MIHFSVTDIKHSIMLVVYSKIKSILLNFTNLMSYISSSN